MKAAELLRLYKDGKRDFRGENLRGQNFKGKDLSGADFSGADIRGANFAQATLWKTNFTAAKAGLQKRWATFSLILALVLLGLSSFLSGGLFAALIVPYIVNSADIGELIGGYFGIAVIVIFIAIALRRGTLAAFGFAAIAFAFALAVAFAFALAVALAGAFAVAGALAFAVALALALAGALAGAFAVAGALAFAVAFAVAGALAGAFAGAGAVAVAGAVAGAFVLTAVYVYIGWRAIKGDPRDAWLRSAAVGLASMGGTCFFRADLTDANFSQAQLKSSDFRQSNLTRTRWRDATKLDLVRPGETYLNDLKIQKLLITGDGKDQSFESLVNLGGINLAGADLENASFAGSTLKEANFQGANLTAADFTLANLNYANLQDADLSQAQLVQTQLDYADLTGSTLTGATIEDWGITTATKLYGIECKYVFMHQPTRDDPEPRRKPDDRTKDFADGEFVDFITPMMETLDLYHNQAVDPRAVAIAFNDLRDQHPDAELEIVSMEKRGQNLDKLKLRVQTNPKADRSQLHHSYFNQYEHLLTLPSEALVALLMEKEDKAQQLAGLLGTAIVQPTTHIDTFANQGDTTVAESNTGTPKYDLRNAKFAGGFAETVQGNQVGGTQYNYESAEKQDLAEAAAEIQRLLKQLEATNPTATEADQKAFVSAAIPATLKQRAVSALKSGGKTALEELLDNAYVNVALALIEGWQDAE